MEAPEKEKLVLKRSILGLVRETETERYQGRCMYVCVWVCGKG